MANLVIDILSSDEESMTPIPVRRPKINTPMKDENQRNKKSSFEDDDCMILDFNPFDSMKKLSLNQNDDEDEISIVGERGQVACRDYPHSRHLCVKFPFYSTPQEKYCGQCYCFVCDTRAPCKSWNAHCSAIYGDPYWNQIKADRKKEAVG